MIYTDKIHLMASTLEELHTFAQSIGLKRYYFHGVRKGHPHYDLTNKEIVDKVVESGVKVMSTRWLIVVSKLNELRNTGREDELQNILSIINSI